MTRILRDPEVRELASFPAAVDIVARAVVGTASDGAAAERSTLRFGSGGWLRIMSGTLPREDVLGYKAFHLVPGGGVRYVCALYRLSTGEPLALIDANQLTVLRTSAAAAAAAARHWGAERPIEVAVIGSGMYARDGLRALASVCRVVAVRVHSPRAESREAFAAALGAELGVPVSAVADPAAATDGADMALCATVTGGRVALRAAETAGLAYVSSIGSTLPSQIELDPAAIVGAARVVIDTPDALKESGDLIAACEAGLDESRIMLLAQYLAGSANLSPAGLGVSRAERPGIVPTGPGNAPAQGGTIYKSIGSIEQDLSLGAAVFRAAEQRDRGQVIAEIELRKEPPR